MIRLPHKQLSSRAMRTLATKQAQIDAIPDYSTRVARAKEMFRNGTDNRTFAEVREQLTAMCAGARRCAYCEDSCADEIEHIRPKDLYPGETFVWENYLYACGLCNGTKNNHWAIFSIATAILTPIGHVGGHIVEPEEGEPVFINPRQEDPLAFMGLDLRNTFYFVPIAEETTQEYQRAEYTIRLLRLNDRDPLPAARKEAYCDYCARLQEYIDRRNEGVPKAELDDLIAALQRMGHPTVWKEMQRQHALIPKLKTLFDQAPEALSW